MASHRHERRRVKHALCAGVCWLMFCVLCPHALSMPCASNGFGCIWKFVLLLLWLRSPMLYALMGFNA